MAPPQYDLTDPMQAFAAKMPPARSFDPATDRLLTVQAMAEDGGITDLLPFVQGTVLHWDKPAGAYTLQVVTASRNAGCHRDYINIL